MTRAESIYNAINEAIGPPTEGAEVEVMRLIQNALDEGLFSTVPDETIAAYCREGLLSRIARSN